MASIKDVAATAGVSVGTVSNVMNNPNRVSPKTVDKVQAAIDQLGFVRNDAARRLRAGRSRSIGMIVLDVSNPFFTDLARGAEDTAMLQGLTVLLGNSAEDPIRETSYLDLFEEQRVRGVLISPFGDFEDRLTQLKAHGIPAVLVDRGSETNAFSSVSVDDTAGGKLAVEHLLNTGKTRIGFVGGPFAIRQVADRFAGAQAAIAEHATATLEVFATTALTVLEGLRIGEQILELAPEDRPDALFAANDLVAVGLLQALVMGDSVRVPEDIAIVGFDDIAFARTAIVPITSVRQPSHLMGETALSILLEEADEPGLTPRQIVFQPELVIRASA
ncbi:MAG: LacI family DNA-binding transcriptional regulator [Actinomycetales bacterium]|nr:LacI family DNA-binding transcriptional regulator [Actinomycetales bacterium]